MFSNQHDPSGMFSKSGKASAEMYIMLHQAMQFGKKKEYSLEKQQVNDMYNPLPTSSQTILKNQNSTKKEISTTDREKNNSSQGFNKNQPFAQTTSREDFYKRFQQEQNQNVYEPKYHLVFKFFLNKSPLYSKQPSEREEELNHKIQKLKRIESYNDTEKQNLTASCDYNVEINKKVTGTIKLDKQLPRLDIFTNKQLNEKRFDNLNLPSVWSKVSRTPTTKINIQGRDTFYKLHTIKQWQLDYTPNYDFVQKNYKLKIPNFEKTIKRKFMLKPNYNLNEMSGSYDYDEGNSVLCKKIQTPQFEKMTSRDASVIGHSTSLINSFSAPKKINSAISQNAGNILNNSLVYQ